MYFKLVFDVNRKIINCSCSDTFQGRKLSFSPMRHREAATHPRLYRKWVVRQEKVWSSADSPQNSFNENPVPVPFSDWISSTHVTPRAGASRMLGEQGESDGVSISSERCP